MRLCGSGFGNGLMDGDERDDRIIREKEFRRSIDIDIGDIEVPEERSEERREEHAST